MSALLASFIFFTRLPFWRLGTPPPDAFKRVVTLWPLTGWLTGGVCASVFWLCSHILSIETSVILAFAARAVLTGALHEDGLADCFDGFGGGTGRERILEIMKDSHIGAYGVIGLILYYLTAVTTVSSIYNVHIICAVIIAADVWSKFCSSQIINVLPYARNEQTAKNKTVYSRFTSGERITNIIVSLPALLIMTCSPALLWAFIAPAVTSAIVIIYFRHKLGGYTGDCCGGCFLLSELSFFITAAALIHSGI